jgi:hypothetical protein
MMLSASAADSAVAADVLGTPSVSGMAHLCIGGPEKRPRQPGSTGAFSTVASPQAGATAGGPAWLANVVVIAPYPGRQRK